MGVVGCSWIDRVAGQLLRPIEVSGETARQFERRWGRRDDRSRRPQVGADRRSAASPVGSSGPCKCHPMADSYYSSLSDGYFIVTSSSSSEGYFMVTPWMPGRPVA